MPISKDTPEGYGSITPYFTVDNAKLLMDFLGAAFDAIKLKENRHPDNRLQHARMRIGSSVIMINESTQDYPVNVSQMHLYVDDCDGTYHQALKYGAISIMEPNERPHGDRMAGIKDPCGNIWWLAVHQPAGKEAS